MASRTRLTEEPGEGDEQGDEHETEKLWFSACVLQTSARGGLPGIGGEFCRPDWGESEGNSRQNYVRLWGLLKDAATRRKELKWRRRSCCLVQARTARRWKDGVTRAMCLRGLLGGGSQLCGEVPCWWRGAINNPTPRASFHPFGMHRNLVAM